METVLTLALVLVSAGDVLLYWKLRCNQDQHDERLSVLEDRQNKIYDRVFPPDVIDFDSEDGSVLAKWLERG